MAERIRCVHYFFYNLYVAERACFFAFYCERESFEREDCIMELTCAAP